MPNRHYNRSAQRERDLVNQARSQGVVAYRTPGSKGATDVIQLDRGRISLIQIKTGGTSAWQDFGPRARDRFREEARAAGAFAYLYWYPAGPKSLQVYPEDKWPGADEAHGREHRTFTCPDCGMEFGSRKEVFDHLLPPPSDFRDIAAERAEKEAIEFAEEQPRKIAVIEGIMDLRERELGA